MQIVWDADLWWILSQVFVVIGYVFFFLVYIPKNRNKILILGIFGSLFFSASFIFTREWTGFYSGGLMLFRNLAFLGWALFTKGAKQTRVFDSIVLGIVVIGLTLITVFTFESWFDIFPALAVLVFSIGLWQKNIKIFRILASVSSAFWIVYLLLVGYGFGLIFESILLGVGISSVVFYNIIEKLKPTKTQTTEVLSVDQINQE